jgi:hypothetical protein
VCALGVSLDVDGRIDSSRRTQARARACPSVAYDQHVSLRLVSSTAEDRAKGVHLDGKLELTGLRHLLSDRRRRAGVSLGRFRLFGTDGQVFGTVVGTLARGTHRPPAARGDSVATPRHWELSLEGTFVTGDLTGARLRAVLALDVVGGADPFRDGVQLQGALEGVVQVVPSLSPGAREQRVRRARQEAEKPPHARCGREVPCLGSVAKTGRGRLTLDATASQRCPLTDDRTRKTWSRLDVSLRGPRSPLADGRLTVSRFMQLTDRDPDGRGEHGGRFEYVARDGTRIRGEMLGVSRGGTHRAPSAVRTEPPDPPGHLEGRLSGVVVSGPRKGARAEARYVLQIGPDGGRRRPATMVLEGWLVTGCFGVSAPAR